MVQEFQVGIDGKPSRLVHLGATNVSGWIYSHMPDPGREEDREEYERYDSRQNCRILSWLREHS
jgi:hypothetical protein